MNKSILYNLTNWTFFVVGFSNLVIGTHAAYTNNSTIAIASLTAGLILLFAATIDRFESLKGLGIEAKTKQLDEKLNEADKVLAYLKEITALTGQSLMDLQSKIGRWSQGPNTKEFIEFAGRIRNIMEKTGSEEKVILNALTPWAKTLCMDLSRKKTLKLIALLTKKEKEIYNELKKISSPITLPNPLYEELIKRKNKIEQYKKYEINNLHEIDLNEYPVRLMAIYDNSPELTIDEKEELKKDIAPFISDIEKLKLERKLDNPYLWIQALEDGTC